MWGAMLNHTKYFWEGTDQTENIFYIYIRNFFIYIIYIFIHTLERIWCWLLTTDISSFQSEQRGIEPWPDRLPCVWSCHQLWGHGDKAHQEARYASRKAQVRVTLVRFCCIGCSAGGFSSIFFGTWKRSSPKANWKHGWMPSKDISEVS